MPSEFRAGNNTDITLIGSLVHKVSRYAFLPAVADSLATELQNYVTAFDSEPVDVPSLEAINIVPGDSGRCRIEHVISLCTGPNLCNLTGDDLRNNVQLVLGQVAGMSTLDSTGTLRVPFDAAANNFHMEDGQGVMVDLFPPLLRRADRSLPLENIQYSSPRIRQRLIPYTRGTREGAILSTLFTAVTGDRPAMQARRIVRGGIDNWCYDVLPATLSGVEKDRIRSQIVRRFIPHFLRNTISDGICGMQKTFGVSSYKDR